MVQVHGGPPLPATLPPLWEDLRSGESALPALCFRKGGRWRSESYMELREAVRELAAGLLAASVPPGGRVALFADTGPWWTKADLAIASIGAISVPIYPTSTSDQIAWILEDSEPHLVLCDTKARTNAIAAIGGDELALEISAPSSRPSLRSSGADAREGRLEEVLARAAAIGTDDLATIVYTSGTTGNPKGCCISHANLAAVLAMNLATERIGPGWVAHRERCYVFLPLAHIAARMHQLISIAVRGELAYGSGGVSAAFDELGDVQPTCLPGVPRLFEKLVALAREGHDGEDDAAAAARELLGGRVSWAISGGAPIEPELVERLVTWGIPLYEGYGMSETSGAIAISTEGAVRPGSVGRPLHGLELRFDAGNEIEVRGPNVFRGYWRNEAATDAAFDDEWFRTGDLGALDREGFLRVLGRTKDVIATAYGKKVAPTPIENEIRHSPLVANAVVCGEGRPFLVGLIELDGSASKGEMETVGRHIAAVNARRSPPERVRRWTALPRPLSIEQGELTASMKIRRTTVERSFSKLLDDLFAGRAGLDAEPAPPAVA